MKTISGSRRQSIQNTSGKNNTINSVTTLSLKNKFTKKGFIMAGLN